MLIGTVLSLLAVTVIVVSITTLAVDSGSPQEDILDCEERASKGSVVLQFNAPDRISIDETKEVSATLTLLDRAAAPGTVDVPSCTIGARLTGIDFAIAPNDVPDQSFLAGRRSLTFAWEIRANRIGKNLTVNLFVRPRLPDGDLIRDGAETRRTRTIDVDDGKTGRKRLFDVVADPVKNNAAIVVASVAGSVLAAIAVARLKK